MTKLTDDQRKKMAEQLLNVVRLVYDVAPDYRADKAALDRFDRILKDAQNKAISSGIEQLVNGIYGDWHDSDRNQMPVFKPKRKRKVK